MIQYPLTNNNKINNNIEQKCIDEYYADEILTNKFNATPTKDNRKGLEKY